MKAPTAPHNPEFTMLELYEAYGDYTTMAVLTRELILGAARAGLGGTVVRRPDGVRARYRRRLAAQDRA